MYLHLFGLHFLSHTRSFQPHVLLLYGVFSYTSRKILEMLLNRCIILFHYFRIIILFHYFRRPIEVQIGGRSIVSDTIEQNAVVIEDSQKFSKLLELLGRYQQTGQVRAYLQPHSLLLCGGVSYK